MIKADDIDKSPIIVTGMWHSGTRMLVDILETAGVDFGRNKNALADSTRDFLDLELNNLCHTLVLKRLNNFNPTKREKRQVAAILSRYFSFNGLWGFKIPTISYVMPYFIKLYPQCRIVAIVRDARDVALSGVGIGAPAALPKRRDFNRDADFLKFYLRHFREWLRFQRLKKKMFFGRTDIKEFQGINFSNIGFKDTKYPPKSHMFVAQLWVESTSRLIANRPYPQYYEVRYEELCQNPGKIIPGILQHAGITKYGNLQRLINIPNTTRIGKWKKVGEDVVREITLIAGELLGKLGYVHDNIPQRV